jgi:hypothetical protein
MVEGPSHVQASIRTSIHVSIANMRKLGAELWFQSDIFNKEHLFSS